MAADGIDQRSIVSYLKAQSHINPALAFDHEKCTLIDNSTTPKCSTILARYRGDESAATRLAPYVGAGAISALKVIATPSDISEPKSNTPGIFLSDAEAMSNLVAAFSDEIESKTELKLGDVVWRDDPNSSPLPDSGAGVVLLLKICGALTTRYDSQTIAKVGKLITNNTITAVHSVSSVQDHAVNTGTAAKVSELLHGLLGPSHERIRSVHMNSNEPVLLINNAGSIAEIKFGSIVTETIEQLQRQWNVWPVRIYAGRFLESSDSSFSISLLNVTNTDIGGPSMIQLLDAPCEARGWLGYARREVWNGRELLEKDERQQEESSTVEAPEASASSQEEEQGIVEDDQPFSDASEEVEEFEHPEPYEEDVIESVDEDEWSKEAAELHISEDQEEVEEPHQDVRKHFEADPAPIRHPTWEHPRGGESLLDLIKSQSSALPEAELEHGDESGAATGNERAEQINLASEEEFVVV